LLALRLTERGCQASFVGERNRQHVVVEAFLGGSIHDLSRSGPMLWPTLTTRPRRPARQSAANSYDGLSRRFPRSIQPVNRYLRTLFVQAAWVVLSGRAKALGPLRLKSWIEAAKNASTTTCWRIALANKLACIPLGERSASNWWRSVRSERAWFIPLQTPNAQAYPSRGTHEIVVRRDGAIIHAVLRWQGGDPTQLQINSGLNAAGRTITPSPTTRSQSCVSWHG